MRKKLLSSVILVLVLLLCFFTGCAEKEPVPLRICVDIEYSNTFISEGNLENDMDLLLKTRLVEYCARAGLDHLENVMVEYLPTSGVERENALTRLRTEIMAGEGPDLFLIYCAGESPGISEEAIFTMPEKAMELSIFLTLDDYMENNTHFAEWDKMNQTVLAAGRTWEGQQIIPLCYTFPASVYRSSEVSHTASGETTWMDMLESEDKALAASAVWISENAEIQDGNPFMMLQTPMTEFLLGPIADFHEEELLFTEDELKQRLTEMLNLADCYAAGEFDQAPVHYNTYLGYEFSNTYLVSDAEYHNQYTGNNGIEWNESHTLVPLYSDDGGLTAEITAYAAINRNAQNPEEAFLILDYLASYQAQQSERIYTDCLYKQFSGYMSGTQTVEYGSIPMYDTLMSKYERVYYWAPGIDLSGQGWYMPDETFASFSAAREQITHVRFRSILDVVLTQIYRDFYSAVRFGGDPDQVVADGYRKIQMMVRE